MTGTRDFFQYVKTLEREGSWTVQQTKKNHYRFTHVATGNFYFAAPTGNFRSLKNLQAAIKRIEMVYENQLENNEKLLEGYEIKQTPVGPKVNGMRLVDVQFLTPLPEDLPQPVPLETEVEAEEIVEEPPVQSLRAIINLPEPMPEKEPEPMSVTQLDHTYEPSKSQKKINNQYLKDFLTEARMAPEDFAERCGLSRTTGRTWIEKVEMPEYAAVLVDGIRYRMGLKPELKKKAKVLITGSDETIAALSLMAQTMKGDVKITEIDF